MRSAYMSSGIPYCRECLLALNFPGVFSRGAHLVLVSLPFRATTALSTSPSGWIFIWLLHLPWCCIWLTGCDLAFSVPGSYSGCVLGVVQVSLELWPKKAVCGWSTLGGPHLTRSLLLKLSILKTKTQKVQIICPRSHEQITCKPRSEHKFSGFKVYSFLYTILYSSLKFIPKHIKFLEK